VNALDNLNISISFWGKVIDQDDKPLAGVTIKGYVMHDTAASPYGYSLNHFDTVTSEEGGFEITDTSGSGLTIESITKEGYELSKNVKTHFGYRGYAEKFIPDESNPVIFKMWKRKTADVMVTCGTKGSIKIPSNGTFFNLDLVPMKQADADGDLQINVQADTSNVKQGNQKYNWNVTINTVNGGLIESNDEFLYLAPENGCTPMWSADMAFDHLDWSTQISKSFYLQIRGGKYYARMNLELMTDYRPSPHGTALLRITCWLNPTGSRNLEYDSRKTITPQRIAQIGLEKAIEEARDPDERQRKYDASLGIPSSGK